jgi:phage minor structural protein
VIFIIKVYDSSETLFATNGIKTLHPLIAEITKKDNDDYFIELRDIIDNLEYYQEGMILRVSTPWGVQGFRCKNPSVKNNRVECTAWHLSYDAKNYIIRDAYSVDKNCNDALDHFNSATDRTSPFITISDISTRTSARMVRKTLFEIYGELVNNYYGGHWYRDNWILGIKSSIGEDRGVVLAQNKNITNMEVSENWDEVCTKILAYTTDGSSAIVLEDPYIELDEKLYDIDYTKIIKFENELNKDDYTTEDEYITATKTWLREQANNYLQNNKLPKVNYSVEAKIDNISDVGDVIYIKHPKCKVDITTNVIKVVYDAIRNKYIKIEFGNFKKEIKNLKNEIIAETSKNTEEKVEENKILLKKELEVATTKYDELLNDGNTIYEQNQILVVDTLPKEDAKYVLKIGLGGIGFSESGINGTFTSVWSLDGTLNMGAINVINLTASLIKGGTLKLGGVNNSSGTFELYDEANALIGLMDKTGLKMYGQDGSYVLMNEEVGFAGYDRNNNKIYWVDKDEFHMKKSVVEEEITLCNKVRFIPITITNSDGTIVNDGIGLVSTNS